MTEDGPDPFTNMFEAPAKFARALFAPMNEASANAPLKPEDMQHWAEVGTKLQSMWMEYQAEQLANPQALAPYFDPSRWMRMAEDWYRQMPIADPAQQQALMQEGMALWQQVLGQYGLGADGQPVAEGEPDLPRCLFDRHRILFGEVGAEFRVRPVLVEQLNNPAAGCIVEIVVNAHQVGGNHRSPTMSIGEIIHLSRTGEGVGAQFDEPMLRDCGNLGMHCSGGAPAG